jgi:hypothetical protein
MGMVLFYIIHVAGGFLSEKNTIKVNKFLYQCVTRGKCPQVYIFTDDMDKPPASRSIMLYILFIENSAYKLAVVQPKEHI